MAFLKTARAIVARPTIGLGDWVGMRRVAATVATRSLSAQAEEILGEPLDPEEFILSHCTIVASVDTEPVPGVKVGKLRVGSSTVDRRWTDYLVRPDTDRFFNNNNDGFSRAVLGKSFRTFIGGQNYHEHVQIEAQSKGRIIDAAIRDIGESLYTDILIATRRRYANLVKMGTLSMGCVCDATQCTKCGHVAADETQLCDCVKYEKGNYFMDDAGNRRRVAELCGHESMGETGGVRFIEASWVKTPAFTGAVLRNVLTPAEAAAAGDHRALASVPLQWSSDASYEKVAAVRVRSFDLADDAHEAPAPPAAETDPLADAEERLYRSLKDRVVQRLDRDLGDGGTPAKSKGLPDGSMSSNENLTRMAYTRLVKGLPKVAASDADLVDRLETVNAAFGVKIANDLYRVALRVGRPNDPATFVRACRRAAGRVLTHTELRQVIRIGSLLARRARIK